jgi:hypothetical protein
VRIVPVKRPSLPESALRSATGQLTARFPKVGARLDTRCYTEPPAQKPCHSAHRKRLILKCRFEQIPLPEIRCLWAARPAIY